MELQFDKTVELEVIQNRLVETNADLDEQYGVGRRKRRDFY